MCCIPKYLPTSIFYHLRYEGLAAKLLAKYHRPHLMLDLCRKISWAFKKRVAEIHSIFHFVPRSKIVHSFIAKKVRIFILNSAVGVPYHRIESASWNIYRLIITNESKFYARPRFK